MPAPAQQQPLGGPPPCRLSCCSLEDDEEQRRSGETPVYVKYDARLYGPRQPGQKVCLVQVRDVRSSHRAAPGLADSERLASTSVPLHAALHCLQLCQAARQPAWCLPRLALRGAMLAGSQLVSEGSLRAGKAAGSGGGGRGLFPRKKIISGSSLVADLSSPC